MNANTPDKDCDTTVDGESDRVNAGKVQKGLLVNASGSTVNADISEAPEPVPVVVQEGGNRVVLDGSDKEVILYVNSDGNSIVVDHNADVSRNGTGSGNSIRRKELESQTVTPEEVVTQSRKEALNEKGLFGQTKLNYQEPKSKEDRCIGCGSTEVATITDYTEKVFILVGYPITLDVTEYTECENCHNFELSDEDWSNTIK